MACCAAAVFIICRVIFALRQMASFLLPGRLSSVALDAVPANPATRWMLVSAGDITNNDKAATSHGAGTISMWQPLSARQVMVLVSIGGLAAFWMLTRPDAPGPLANLAAMQAVHLQICGEGTDDRLRAEYQRDFLARLPVNRRAIAVSQ